MEISVTDGVTTVTTVLRVEVSLLDTDGPQLAPGCLLAVTVASKSSVTLSRLHLAYIVSFHLFLNLVNAASPYAYPFLSPPKEPSSHTPLCYQCGFLVESSSFDCVLTTAAKKEIIDSFIQHGFKAIRV